MRAALAVAASLVALAGCGGADAAPPEPAASPLELRTTVVARGVNAPIQVVAVPGRPADLLVVQQTGLVRVLRGGTLLRRPFLDLRRAVTSWGEQGLLALALSPGYPRDGRGYAHYSDRRGDTRVVELRRGPGGVRPARTLLSVDQPYPNHNGGQLAFGPDGRLWLGLGDGGSAFDPEQRSQNPATPFGKLLRLDVAVAGARWETVASGLRNPWRFAFDPASGDLWIGDVGQDRWEEVDHVPRGELGGPLNFGWAAYEGRERLDGKDLVEHGRLVEPLVTYGRDDGCSITGGVVYRGRAIPELRGRYLFGDFCDGTIWSVRERDGEPVELRRERPVVPGLTSFGTDAAGEVYLTSADGTVRRLVAP